MHLSLSLCPRDVAISSMTEADCIKLLGSYRTPRFKYGAVVTCAIGGPVKIVGLSSGRIQWPKCRLGKRSRAIILYGALADAVRTESAKAVMYWFGVGSDTIWMWRTALGVERVTEGTSELMSRWQGASGGPRCNPIGSCRAVADGRLVSPSWGTAADFGGRHRGCRGHWSPGRLGRQSVFGAHAGGRE
jgi:hypothetical protein